MHACMHARFYLYVHRYLNKTYTWNFLIFKPFSKLFAIYHFSWNCLELISFFLCKEVLFPASQTLQHFFWNCLETVWHHFVLKNGNGNTFFWSMLLFLISVVFLKAVAFSKSTELLFWKPVAFLKPFTVNVSGIDVQES